MKKDTRNKVDRDTEIATAAGQRLTVEQENRRQFVRLEIISPMWLRRLKDIFGTFTPEDHDGEMTAEILNLGAGGVLVELAEPLNEGDIVIMRFRLQGTDTLEHVLGLVKRADQDGDFCLAGIEFVTREHLRDRLTTAELDLLGDQVLDFNESVRQVLSRYLYHAQQANHSC